jgi:hypothetical protein
VKKYLVLIVLLVGILFPFASLMTVSDSYAAAFEMLFGTLASHIIMHAVLYAVLTLILLFIFRDLPQRKAIPLILLLVPVVAVLQEVIQAASVSSLRVNDTIFDLVVDSVACGIILSLYAWWAMKKEKPARGDIIHFPWRRR